VSECKCGCVKHSEEMKDSPSGTHFVDSDDSSRDNLYEIELSNRRGSILAKVSLDDLKITIRQEVYGGYRDICYMEGGEKELDHGPGSPFAEIIIKPAKNHGDDKGPGAVVRLKHGGDDWEDDVDILAISCGT